jgi:CRISPR-associated protein Cmr2
MEYMSDTILIFSLGPVQGLIAQARRVGDLDAGSRLLVELSRAAGMAIQSQGGDLIFPASLGGDVPNKLVARVPEGKVEKVIEAAQRAIEAEWRKHISRAQQPLKVKGPAPDRVWEDIWERQVGALWETYWAAAPETGDYHAAYDAASRAFDAAKRTRVFQQVEESGLKDSLSGQRSALRTADLDARAYWAQVASNVTSAELRSKGRERLDAIGAIKRWGGLSGQSPSVSHIATADFRAAAQSRGTELNVYRKTVENLLQGHLYKVSNDNLWPYDGDLFFLETLTPERLEDSYGITQPQPGMLQAAQLALRTLHRAIGFAPSPYYVIIAFDGDDMGKMVRQCQTEREHKVLSQRIINFAGQVRGIVDKHHGHTVYAGGDDVLALVPLSEALPLAQELADSFEKIVRGTASAGIAVAHHLYPLDAALSAAREAERQAKRVPGKASVCVRVLRRSGETVDVRSPWSAIGNTFNELIEFFHSKALSSRFAYTVADAAYALPEAGEAFEAEVRRLLHRHRRPDKWTASEAKWAVTLRTWASHLPGKTKELGHWLTLARFVAQGGVE